ncbi:carboxypeptidase-like regulatory domain-containing protein [Anatilimnocola floriformis]|uniref:carboxypeptidase-like regulatory domain-containing protein n=1 Tax=Anatilimnocola floriformis TaxID=2948575 RepID=UPI0020C37EBD|nr:carboxypeptidase-like regulatory domain-containing protein [Anatilimnocola floriformis]
MRNLLFIVALVALASGLGCNRGEVLGPVHGVITVEGTPVERATVMFSNDQKGVHMNAVTDSQGRYVVRMANGDGLPLGDYKVRICPPIQDHPLGPIKAPPANVDPFASTIPSRYRDVKTSDLKLSVTEKSNSLDVDMKRN